MAQLRGVIQGDHASGEEAAGGMPGVDPMRLAQIVAGATAQNLLQLVSQNDAGTRRWIYARDPGLNAGSGLSVAAAASLFNSEVMTSALADKTRARYYALWRGFVTFAIAQLNQVAYSRANKEMMGDAAADVERIP